MSVRATIDPLSWESSFFSLRLGRVQFNEDAAALTPAALDSFSIVQAKVAMPAQINSLSALGFQLVAGEMDCCYTLPPVPTVVATELVAVEMRLADEADIPALRALAAETLEISRFCLPWFSHDERRRFYAQWVENAVRGNFDHCCLVAAGPSSIAGLVTLRDTGAQSARIGLLAVAPKMRGTGTGKLLFRAALGWCCSRSVRKLWVATQTTNLPALQFYIASGARVVHSAYWLYRGSHDSI